MIIESFSFPGRYIDLSIKQNRELLAESGKEFPPYTFVNFDGEIIKVWENDHTN